MYAYRIANSDAYVRFRCKLKQRTLVERINFGIAKVLIFLLSHVMVKPFSIHACFNNKLAR